MRYEAQKAMDALGYHEKWLAYGAIEESELLEQYDAFFVVADDTCTEHYRWRSYCHWIDRTPNIDQSDVERFIELARLDTEDFFMFSAYRYLLENGKLDDELYSHVSQRAIEYDEKFKALSLRFQVFKMPANIPLPDDMFEKCVELKDGITQRSLIERKQLNKAQYQVLAESGAVKAVRNAARQRAQHMKG